MTMLTRRIRRGASLAAAAGLALGLTACAPEQPFFASTTTAGVQVSGGFRPVAGDFDGDGWDDVWWFHPTGQDRLWEGRPDGAFAHLVAPLQLNGPYRGVAGDFGGDGAEDVLWYAEGAGDSTLVVTQVGGGVASSRSVALPEGLLPALVEDAGSRGGVRLAGYATGDPTLVWDVDRGTDAVTSLAGAGPSGDFDGDGAADVLLYAAGAAADRVAWGDGAGGFTLQTVQNVTGDYGVVAFDGDGDGRDDLAFFTDPMQTGAARMNLWFGAQGRTFRRETRDPFCCRGLVEVHRSHTGGRDTLVRYWHGGAESWTIDAEGVTRVGPAGEYPGPFHLEPLVGRFHDGVADDVLRYDEANEYPESLLRTPGRPGSPVGARRAGEGAVLR